MLHFVLAQKQQQKKTFRGNQQNCWSKNLDRIHLFVVFALEQNFRK